MTKCSTPDGGPVVRRDVREYIKLLDQCRSVSNGMVCWVTFAPNDEDIFAIQCFLDDNRIQTYFDEYDYPGIEEKLKSSIPQNGEFKYFLDESARLKIDVLSNLEAVEIYVLKLLSINSVSNDEITIQFGGPSGLWLEKIEDRSDENILGWSKNIQKMF